MRPTHVVKSCVTSTAALYPPTSPAVSAAVIGEASGVAASASVAAATEAPRVFVRIAAARKGPQGRKLGGAPVRGG
jgi:hypothetical protein